MSSPSTISGARAALVTLLNNATVTGQSLDGVQVTFGPPSQYEQQEVVALLGVEVPEEIDALLGSRKQDEIYELVVGIKAHNPAADTAATVDARGFTIADAVRALVYADSTLPALLKGWSRVSRQTTEGVLPAEGGGWVIFLRLHVRCHARI